MWYGAAAICVHDGKLLMVLQGRPDEEKKWSVPSGGKLEDDSFEECCMRETWEETGYRIEIKQLAFDKQNPEVLVRYYIAEVIGGAKTIQDPDELIHEIAWKTAEEIRELNLSFPEDRERLLGYIPMNVNDHMRNVM